MSGETVELVRRIFAGWERGDYSSVEWADPEIEFVTGPPEAGTHHGLEAMGSAWATWLGAWREFQTRAEEFVDGGDHVLVIVGFGGRGRGSGLAIEGTRAKGANLFTIRNGTVVRLVLYASVDEARGDFEALRTAG